MTMREKIAQALHDRFLSNPDTIAEMRRDGPLPVTIDGLHNQWRDRLLGDADAVLAAMREPTNAMLEAGWEALDNDTSILTAFMKVFPAMIDAARNDA